MSEDVRAAVGKMSRVLRLAKDRANTQFGKVRERAKRFSLGGSPTTSQSAPSATESSSAFMEDPDQKVKQLMDLGFSEAAARHALRACGGHLDIAGPWLLDEQNADELLAAEVAAQEVGSPARPPLAAGGRARVTGLQTASAAALNGSDVLLQKWDAASQRWIVSMPDGTVKSIRPQNLDPLYASPHGRPVHEDEPAEQTEQTEQRYSAGQPEQSGQHQAGPASASAAAPEDERSDLDREELKILARTMLESTGQPRQQSVTDEVLEALSEADLLELIDGLSRDLFVRTDGQQEAQEPPARPDVAGKIVELELEETRLRSLAEAQAKRAEELEAREAALQEAEAALERRRSEGKEPAEASAPAVRIPFVAPKEDMQDASPTSTTLEAERAELQRLREEASEMQTWAHVRMSVEAAAKDLELRQEAAKLELEETRLRSLAEAQAKRAEELEAREAALQEAEAALERRRSEGKEPAEASAPAVRIPFVAPKEDMQDASPTSTTLEAERAELQRLREGVEAAAKDLELRQEAAKRAAEERELQFLEEESAQGPWLNA
ncbi:unnamed protein product [Symbiodinium natans]|uniref:UBA domain-containing protein n=1 Tax=Symbiodinium natans TaxID=878477 RepID=A0A812GNT3_9DINO|nr:unnamed protein product [Symbiodinium natans]